MKLTKAQKDLIAALRSGDYKQIRKRLHDGEDGYCCLGVACDVSGLGEWNGRNMTEGGLYTCFYLGEEEKLPKDVMNYYNFHDSCGEIKRGKPNHSWMNDHHHLIEANDSGVTFYQIAVAMEQYPEKFFKEETE